MSTRAAIETAFASVPYPGDKNIVLCLCAECQKSVTFLRGKNWRDLKREDVQKYQSAISLFTPAALHYFLPAYMLACLDAWWDVSLMPFLIAQQFVPAADNEDAATKRRREERLAVFTPAQRAAIAAFLRDYAASNSTFVTAAVHKAVAEVEKSLK